jgi:ribosomal peptide maturation radical SAM protein 1
MRADVVICCAPVMSVVRPSAALGLLQAALEQRKIAASSLYLNMLFAESVGVDVNERLADLPTSLLIGDWLFADRLGPAPAREEVARHRRLVDAELERKNLVHVKRIRGTFAARFVERAAAVILDRRPRIVGFSTMFQQTAASLAIAAEVRKLDPSIVICFGGANCHGPMGPVLLRNYPQIDFVFTGEADFDFPEFADTLLAGGEPTAMGAGFVGRAAPAANPAVPVIDLDQLPIPDYRDYFDQLSLLSEKDRVRSSIPFESSRGCWWGKKKHCTFCGLNAEGMTFRSKTPERVVRELDVLFKAYGVSRFAATDNILSLDHVDGVLLKLANRPASGRVHRLFYEIKSNMDQESLETLARAGVVWVQPGIESLSDEVLRLMRKGVNALLNMRMMRNCRELGMGIIWSILYGFPGEPAEVYEEMAQFSPLIEHLQPPVSCVRIRLDRFSPNFERAAEMGFRGTAAAPAYGAIYNVPQPELQDLAYFFEGSAPDAASEDDLVSLRAAVAAWRARWFGESTPPQLTLVRVGAGGLVRDTRSIATAPMHYLEPAELALIDAMREPCDPASVLAKLSGDLAPRLLADALERIVQLHLVLMHRGKALSLVVDSSRTLFDADDRADAPTGYLRQRPSTPKLDSDEADWDRYVDRGGWLITETSDAVPAWTFEGQP